VNFCWFCLKWGVLLALIGGALGVAYYYQRLNDEIRSRVEEKIARQYPGLKVSVRSASLVEGEGIELRGLSIVEPGAEGPAELVYLDEVFLHCAANLKDLLGSDPEVTHVTIRRSTLRATRRPDGSYSSARLLPVPRFSDKPPPVTVENGTIEIFDPQKNPSGTLTLRDVNLTLTPPETSGTAGQSEGPRKLCGTMTGDHLRQVELRGVVDASRKSWSIHGSIEGLDVSPELLKGLPDPLAAKLAVAGELRGQAVLSFRASADASSDAALQWEVSGVLTRARLDDPRLPHPLTDVQTKFRLDNKQLVVEELVARSGSATVQASYRQDGFEAASQRFFHGRIEQLELDRELFASLPDSLKQQWNKYRPYGVADVEAKLTFDGKTWHPDLTARCLDVSFLHHKLPYRLDQGKGVLRWKGDSVEVHLTAFSRSRPVWVDGEVHNLDATPTGWCEVKGNSLELDEKLFDALPAKAGEVVRSLRPRGTVNFRMNLSREASDQPMRKQLQIGLNGCSVQYEKFPYPLANIRGTLEMVDDRWVFRDLAGSNDTGRVLCEGHLVPGEEGKELLLRFTASDVSLEAELRDALKPNIQRVWNALKPRGMVDFRAEVRYLPGVKQLSVGVRARPQSETASICPVRFPYRLEKLQGELIYENGCVTLERFKGEHGSVRVSGSGRCRFLPDGGWEMQFEGLNVDRLRFDRELVPTLPPQLRNAVAKLKPQGPINVRGSFTLLGSAREKDPLGSRWDLDVGFHQGSIDCGVQLENMFGTVKLAGASDGVKSHCRGELALDSLTCKDWQFTEVRGPVWIDNRRVLLGSWVDRQKGTTIAGGSKQPPRPLTARLFGGAVSGDGWIDWNTGPKYHLNAVLTRASLARCAQDVMTGRQNLRGTVTAAISLQGNGPSRHAMLGKGGIQLRNADIYELPLMIALLKLLSIRTPDQNAFSSSDVDFRIVGEHIYLDRINFRGDAVSLLGKGEMDFQRNIRLKFYPIVGRGDLGLPIISELFHGASQQFMLIHVGGTLQNPQTHQEVLPNVNQVLQQLSDDLQITPDPANRFPGAQRMPNPGRGWRK